MKKIALILFVVLFWAFPAFSFAATSKLQFSAWFPFWEKASAVNDFTLNMDSFNGVSLFSYEVQKDGTLKDMLKMQQGAWLGWLTALNDYNIKVTPTVSWTSQSQIYNTLSSSKLRKAHIQNLVNLSMTKPYNGIDIDYENKSVKTKNYFSTFLKELSLALHKKNKKLSCTIEARTPATSRFTVVPKDLDFSNDYKKINSYCDEVRIMAYDQRNDDIALNKQKGSNGNLYMPVADNDWVEKVIKETSKTINKNKIVLGIPTYGHEYIVSLNGTSTPTYKRVGSITYKSAMDLANSLNIAPARNSAGEMSFTYTKLNNSISEIHYVTFTDAGSVESKVKLAKKYGLKGTILFKLDGDNDPTLYTLISKLKS